MARGLKILACTMVFLGVLSLIFLLTAKKKSQVTSAKTTVQANSQNTKQATTPIKKVAVKQVVPSQVNLQKIKDQWQQCKNKTMTTGKTLFWNVRISDASSFGGYYAKGFLGSDSAYLVHITIKIDSQNADQIRQKIIVGNTALLRGTCVGVETDGSVMLEVF